MTPPILFVPEVSLSPNLSIATCLVRNGYRVITGSRDREKGPIRSVPHIHYPVDDDIFSETSRNEVMAAAVVAALPPSHPVLAICGSDRAIGLLRIAKKRHGALDLCYPDAKTQARLTSKTAAHAGFAAHGLPVPKGRSFVPGDEACVDAWDYPVIFKYDTSEGSLGVHVVEDAETLSTFAAKAALLDTPFIVEEFIGPTREISYSFFVKGGNIYPAYGLEKEFHFRTSYSTTIRFMSQAEEHATFAAFHDGLARILGDGFYCAQFKDSDRGMVLIEINGRLGNNYRIINRVVPDLAALIVDLYRGADGWEDKWRAMRRAIRPVHAISLIEDLYARMCHLGGLIRRGSLRDGAREMGLFLSLCSRRPYIDDYTTALWRSPGYAIAYYASFFAAARSQKTSTIALKKMVPR